MSIPYEARHLPGIIDELRGDPHGDFGRSWQNAPDNTFVYQQISRAFPTAVVWRGRGEVSEFERDEQDLSTVSFENIANETETFAALVDRTMTNGLLVLKDGHIVHEEYRNGLQPHVRHHWMSATKSMTSTMFGTLVDSGDVDLDATVPTYAAELRGSVWDDVIVRDVLDMRSDVQYREEFDNPMAEVWEHEAAVGWRNVGLGRPATNRQFLAAMRKQADRDGLFHYRSSETDVLGLIAENVTRLGGGELVSRRIWSLLGAEEDAAIIVDREGAAVMMGGFCSTLRDAGRWGQMIANGGVVNGQRIISESWTERVRHGDVEAFAHYSGLAPKGAYSAQFWVTDDERGITSALGYGGQMVYIDTDVDLVIVKFSAWDQPDYDYAVDTWRAFAAISDHYRAE